MPCLLSLITVCQSLFMYKITASWTKAQWDKILAQLGYSRNSQCQHCTLNQQTWILKYKSNLHATSSVLKGISYMKRSIFLHPVLWPKQDYFTYFEPIQAIKWRKARVPGGKKTPGHLQAKVSLRMYHLYAKIFFLVGIQLIYMYNIHYNVCWGVCGC